MSNDKSVVVQSVSHVCSVCDEVIMDSVFTMDGVVMCEKDYQVKIQRSINKVHN